MAFQIGPVQVNFVFGVFLLELVSLFMFLVLGVSLSNVMIIALGELFTDLVGLAIYVVVKVR